MTIQFIQTSDPVVYRPMLEASSRTVRKYCSDHGMNYDCFIGLKRGFHPWHATFNRIPMLRALVSEGFRDWVCYMDADAYIADLNFDLIRYLEDKGDIMLIGAPSGAQPPKWWDMNIGVFMMNLGHKYSWELVRRWSDAFDAISDAELMISPKWDDVQNDQNLFHKVLQEHEGSFRQYILKDDKSPRIFNWQDGHFIKQVVRHGADNIEQRLSRIERAVSSILEGSGIETFETRVSEVEALQREFLSAMYKVVLLRDPDPEGLEANSKRMRTESRSFAECMRECFRSPEFVRKFDKFKTTYGLGS